MNQIIIASRGSESIPPVIWLASYPRSGNTLLRTILWQCFGLLSASIYTNEFCGNRTMEGFVGHIEPGADGRIYLPPNSIPLIKTHGHPIDANPAIYVVRDGVAASVSLWEFYNREIPLEAIIEGRHQFGTWSSHLQAWKPWERPRTLLLKYEDMMDNLAPVLRQIGSFLHRDILKDSIPDRNLIAQAGDQWVKPKHDWSTRVSPELMEKFISINKIMMPRFGNQTDR